MLRQKIFLTLFGLTLILGMSESFLRFYPDFGYRYHCFKFKCEKLDISDFSYLRPSALLGYEHIPNCIPKVNSYGLIGKEYKLEKDKDTFRILILGDSIAEQGHPCQFLEEQLNSEPKLRSKYTFEVWNAGVASYGVRKYALYLQHRGLNYKPDMVIIFLFMNDFILNTNIYYKTKNGTTEYDFLVSEISKVYIPNPFLMRHSYLYRFVVLRLNSFLVGRRKTQGIDIREEDGRYYLRRIERICQKKDIPLFVAIFPYLKPLNAYDDVQVSQYSTICKVVRDLGISHVNLCDLYKQLIEENFSLRESKEDDIHPSKETHRLIAQKIYNCILDNLLNKG